MHLIAGDIGGTKTLLQLLRVTGSESEVLLEKRFESEKYATFDALLREFFEQARTDVDGACFAVAGPVVSRQASLTNLRWSITSAALERDFPISRVVLVNDFYAVAIGIPYLGEEDVLSLNQGERDRNSPIAILGAGTGLGEAFLIPDEVGWRVVPSEGGHSDFAPVTDEHAALLAHLRGRFGRVSYERVLSGPGLVNIFTFVTGRAGNTSVPEVPDDPDLVPPVLAELADSGEPLATRTFEIFTEIYGAEAGNLALKVIARGGVYLAGGIAAKNAARFTDGRFLRFFSDKGRFSDLLRQCPVDLITNSAVGLLGASILAMRECGAVPLHRSRG